MAMGKTYSLVCPAIEPGRGRTRELLEELDALWLAGRIEGGGEICAALHVLADEENLPGAFNQSEGSPIVGLLRDFVGILTASEWTRNAGLQRILKARSEQSLTLEAAGLSSATGALHAVLQSLGACGGEVVTTSLNYIGVANAILLAGARPRFVDIDRRTWCMDPEAARASVNDKTRAILLTHLNHFADLELFYDICEAGGKAIPLVQDASLAIGSQHDGLRPGLLNIGRPGATVLSLTISKIISGMGGAIVVSDSRELTDRVRTIGHQGIGLRNESIVEEFGANYKLSALTASIAREMLKRFDAIVVRRRELKARFDEGLSPLVSEGLIELQGLRPEDAVTHYGMLLPEGVGWREFALGLFERHRIIAGRWHCMHEQEIYRQVLCGKMPKLPVTEAIGARLIFLPFHTALSDDDAKFICRKAVEEVRRAAAAGR
jgi:dTDP-4-amino-4,6-dideoxygalactose transaminase